MTEKISKQSAQVMLDQLKELDKLVHRAYYEMGRILHALKHYALWDVLGYQSFRAMIEEELSCSYASALKYASVYGHCKRLKYTREETIGLIENLGLRSLDRMLPSMNEKLSIRALQFKKQKLNRCVAFWVSPEDEAFLEEVLQQYGMTIKDGKWMRSSEALLAMITARQKAA